MSISIGKTPRYEVSDIALTIYTNASNLLKLNSDQQQNNLQFRDFKLGQQNTSPKSLHLYHSNVLLTHWTSNQLQFLQSAQFQSNLTISKNLTIQSNLTSLSFDSSNLQIQYSSSFPLRMYDRTQSIFLELNSNGDLKHMGNIGIGLTNPQYALDVIGSAYVHSNIYNGYTNASNLYVNEIRNLQNYLLLKNTSIELNAPEVIIDNPTLLGTITYDGTISLQQSIINTLSSCNIRVINKSLNKHGVSITQLNPSFGLTSNHNAIHIDSYFSSVNRTLPIFVVDTFGRISSGRHTSNLPDPDAFLSYEIDNTRDVYLSGFMNLSTCNAFEQTIIDKKGHIGISTSSTQHFLQITNPYTSYESYYQRPSSLIGLYQTTNNAKPYMLLYNCNEAICFQINSNGDLLFQPQKIYDNRYRFEVTSNAYIRYVHTDHLNSSTGIVNFTQSYLSNINQVISNKIYVEQGGSLSNLFITGLTVDDINIGAFDYINIPSTNYEEFRIATTRLLYIGSNFVMNPNPYFFEVEQSNLTNDKIRIYANGGPTEEINVLHTIANNRISTLNITNCNTTLNSVAQIQFDANNNIYQFGIVNTADFYGEGYITCNVDVTNTNRELTFTNDGTRIGTKIHLSKTGKVTLNDTTPGIHTLGMNGDLEVISGNTSNFIVTSQGNIGFGTNQPRTYVDIDASNVLLFGNLGVGILDPSYPIDISGILNATRIVGVKYTDLRGGAFNQWVISETGIYFNQLSSNIGIGTTAPSASIHVHTSNNQGISLGSYMSQLSIPIMSYYSSQSLLKVNGGMMIGYISTSNQYLAPKDGLIVDGSIGIGTTIPVQSLHIQRDAKFAQNTSNDTNVYVGTNYDIYISTKLTDSNVLVRSGNYETIQTSLAEGYSNIAYFPPTGMVRNSAVTSNGTIIEWDDMSVDGQGALAGLSNIIIAPLGYYHGMILNLNDTVVDNLITYYTQITVPVSLSNIVSTASQIHKFELSSDGRYGGGSVYFGGIVGDKIYDHTVIENRIYSRGTQKSELLIFKGSNIANNGPDRIRMRAGRIAMDVYSTATTNRNAENIRGYVTNTGIYGLTNVTMGNLQTNSLVDTNGIYMLQRNIYDTPGEITITTPTNLQYSYARIQMWGAGGGGGGADYQGVINNGAGSIIPGGGAGGGGAYGEIIIPWNIIANSAVTANIGYGGSGGLGGYIATTTAITANRISSTAGVGQAATNGIDGTATTLSLSMIGGNSTLTANWYANGGVGGKVGVGTNAGAAGAGGTVLGTFDSSQSGTAGGAGGSTASGAAGTNLTASGFAASGGGGGGGLPATLPAPKINHSAGNSGTGCIPAAYLSGTAAKALGEKVDGTGTITIASQSGYTIYDTYGGGTGGGGSSSLASTIAGGLATANRAKDGGWPGGGGGGGGSAKQVFPNTGYSGYGASVTAGYGGNGGNGAIIITYY